MTKYFLSEEVRSGYKVSSEMKKVWKIELDLLTELLKVCSKYNLKIYASGGTMLGAVRHKGFIPWDDDIDMMMMREDYEKLCSIAQKEFSHPYFFQTEDTDKGSLRGHAQLRNSETTGILESEKNKKLKFNQGIFIDIFPLDSVIDNKFLFFLQGVTAVFFRKLSSLYGKLIQRKNILHLKQIPKNPFFPIFIKICKQYNHIKNTKMLSTLSFIFFKKNHQKFASDFKDGVMLDFEYMKIPVVKEYGRALTQEFGNWREFKIGTSNHKGVFFDTEKSYKHYID